MLMKDNSIIMMLPPSKDIHLVQSHSKPTITGELDVVDHFLEILPFLLLHQQFLINILCC